MKQRLALLGLLLLNIVPFSVAAEPRVASRGTSVNLVPHGTSPGWRPNAEASEQAFKASLELADEAELKDVAEQHAGSFLFVNGQYVPPPHQIEIDFEAAKLLVNGQPIVFEGYDDDDQYDLRRSPPNPSSVLRRQRRDFAEALECGLVLIAFEGLPVAEIDACTFFRCLLENRSVDSNEYDDLMSTIRDPEVRDATDQWLASYTPTASLTTSAQKLLNRYRETEAKNQRQNQAITTLGTMTYPMTMFGLIIGVYAFGHLMMTTPNTPKLYPHAELLQLMGRASVVSVILICAHAALDLTWTLLNAQAGYMREINPVGLAFIDSPRALIAFKATVTLGACGLLVCLRHHRIAQTACWWMCLVCTILTFRWLIFNSMLV